MTLGLEIRVGVPEASGLLLETAAQLHHEGRYAPILLSAGALWLKHQRRFTGPSAGAYALDVALDSAGFSAMRHHGGYPWDVEDYVELAACGRWLVDRSRTEGDDCAEWNLAWWAQMDLCCEPEIATDRAVVLERVKGTAKLLEECREAAEYFRDEGHHLDDPMPVLQGWRPEDYARSAELADGVLGGEWPDLVGVGSVCRRDLPGPVGVWAVLDRLDRVLPRHVRVHLFGQKGEAIHELAGCARVASLDSCAWDDRYRHELGDRRRALCAAEGIDIREANKRIPANVVERAEEMRRWYEAAVRREEQGPKPGQQSLFWRAPQVAA